MIMPDGYSVILPIITKKVSDLLSKWVGETEQNIAAAFHEAKNQNAILLIDEIDSFVSSRSSSKQMWENNLVNEMLTQMENFEGIFIASTNMIDVMDKATARRFDAKIKFDYLTENQVSKFITSFCKAYDIKTKKANINQACKKLNVITPGDFALIARQNRFYPVKSLDNLIKCLEEEQDLKGENKMKMGFV